MTLVHFREPCGIVEDDSSNRAVRVSDLGGPVCDLIVRAGGGSGQLPDLSIQLNEPSARLHELSVQLHDLSVQLGERSGQLPEAGRWLNELSVRLNELSVQVRELSVQVPPSAPARLRACSPRALAHRMNEKKENDYMTEITLMPSPHAEGAKALLEKIRALRAEIPRFNGPAAVNGRRLGNLLGVSDQFMEAASVAVQDSSRLEQAAGVNASTLRDSFGYAISYDAIVRELTALARDVANSIRAQRAEAAASALDVYAIGRRLARQKDGAELARHVETMRLKLKRKRTRRTASEPVPAPSAAKAPPTAA